MEKENRVYLLFRKEQRVLSFLIHGSRAVEIHCDEAKGTSELGNIYIGKVKNIAKNIGAAFVEIAPNAVCYLSLDELRQPVYLKKGSSPGLQAGDELLVQVLREGIKTKAPALTTNLTLHGKFVLLTTGNRQISVSSKLAREERQRLTELVREYERQDAADCRETSSERSGTIMQAKEGERFSDKRAAREYGWLIRTNAGGVSEQQITADLGRLKRQYQELMQKAQYRTCYSCLAAKPPSYLARLSDLYAADADRILTDDAGLYEELRSYLQDAQPEDLDKLFFYKDRLLPMEKLYSLETHLKEALSERVWLRSGGYLVIQPTEALTVIDVNTGKFEGGKKKEATFLKINREAAVEIARQLRLRNLSGIILVDFINMEQKESEEALLALLEEELHRDPIRTVLVDMTKLSLVEITRMKRERPLHEVCGNYFGSKTEKIQNDG